MPQCSTVIRLLWFAVSLVAVCLISCPVPATPVAANALLTEDSPTEAHEVTVTGTTHNATVIRIRGDTPCSPLVRYANATWFGQQATYDREASGLLSCTSNAVRITGLAPGTRYHYMVNGCGDDGKDRAFTTFPVSGACRFVVYGDTREQAPLYTQADRHAVVAGRIAGEEGILFVVNSGDLVADCGDREEWRRFFSATEELRSRTTYLAVPGNHDADRNLFGDSFGWTGPYSFACGDTQVTLLDSNDISGAALAGQAAMVSSLPVPPSGAGVAILHHPLYSSDEKHYGGWENLQEVFLPAFRESGVRLVFSGHVHAFEQVEREGITFITEARGGAPAYPLNSTRIPGSVRAYENTLGYSIISVDPVAGRIVVDVKRVADVSPDLRSIDRVYPEGTTDARIVIPLEGAVLRFFWSAGLKCRLALPFRDLGYRGHCDPLLPVITPLPRSDTPL